MLFNSIEFIYIFLPISLFLYFLLPTTKLKLLSFTAASYFFYGYWNYKFLPLLLFSSTLDFYIGKKIINEPVQKKRKQLLFVSIVSNLSLLGFFKYFNFFIDSISSVGWLSPGALPVIEIVLPVGISFYTFQSMSYSIDVYRKKIKTNYDFLSFLTYVSAFPQLVAGPIIRHDLLVPQFMATKTYKFNSDNFSQGLAIFVTGLAKKIIIADTIALSINGTIGNIAYTSALEAWACLIGYSLQIYFDFSGYSDMAIGLGKMFNLKFPINFNSPYKSKNITEFWQRWHISLSTWLRDYLYIPLGGSHHGNFNTYLNLTITMFLGGLWHGANWIFVLWGLGHGLLLASERFIKNKNYSIPLPNFVKTLITFILITLLWVLFRSPDLAFAITWYQHLFDFSNFSNISNFSSGDKDKLIGSLIISLFIVFKFKNSNEMFENYQFTIRQAIWIGFLLALSTSYFSKDSPFLYFQF